jgi:transcriptional regulator with XRE-family HTH domain
VADGRSGRGSTGSRILAYRRRRGLTQEQLGGLIGRSRRWVRDVELDHQEVSRFADLVSLAEVLGTTPGNLMGGPMSLAPRGAPAMDGMVAVRRALLPNAVVLEDGPPPDLGALRRDLRAGWDLRQGCEYIRLGLLLPGLIASAKAAAAHYEGHDREIAYGLLAQTLYLTARLSQIVGDMEQGAAASLAALAAAEQSGDALILAMGSYRYSNPLLRSGRHADARDVCISAAERVEPLVSADNKAAVSVHGALMLMAAVASGRLSDRPGAADCLDAAQVDATRLDGEQRNDYWTAFGPTNVAVHRVSVAVELGDFGDALRLADDVDVTRFPPEMAERRSRVLVEIARSYMAARKDEAAMQALMQADQIAPEEVRYQVIARDMVRAVLRRRRTAVPGTSHLADRMGLVAS